MSFSLIVISSFYVGTVDAKEMLKVDLTKQVKISRPRNFAAPRNEKNHMLPDAKKLVKNLGENPKLPAKFLLE